jgi:predicted Zn-dependent protease with MMP-like domain
MLLPTQMPIQQTPAAAMASGLQALEQKRRAYLGEYYGQTDAVLMEHIRLAQEEARKADDEARKRLSEAGSDTMKALPFALLAILAIPVPILAIFLLIPALVFGISAIENASEAAALRMRAAEERSNAARARAALGTAGTAPALPPAGQQPTLPAPPPMPTANPPQPIPAAPTVHNTYTLPSYPITAAGVPTKDTHVHTHTHSSSTRTTQSDDGKFQALMDKFEALMLRLVPRERRVAGGDTYHMRDDHSTHSHIQHMERLAADPAATPEDFVRELTELKKEMVRIGEVVARAIDRATPDAVVRETQELVPLVQLHHVVKTALDHVPGDIDALKIEVLAGIAGIRAEQAAQRTVHLEQAAEERERSSTLARELKAQLDEVKAGSRAMHTHQEGIVSRLAAVEESLAQVKAEEERCLAQLAKVLEVQGEQATSAQVNDLTAELRTVSLQREELEARQVLLERQQAKLTGDISAQIAQMGQRLSHDMVAAIAAVGEKGEAARIAAESREAALREQYATRIHALETAREEDKALHAEALAVTKQQLVELQSLRAEQAAGLLAQSGRDQKAEERLAALLTGLTAQQQAVGDRLSTIEAGVAGNTASVKELAKQVQDVLGQLRELTDKTLENQNQAVAKVVDALRVTVDRQIQAERVRGEGRESETARALQAMGEQLAALVEKSKEGLTQENLDRAVSGITSAIETQGTRLESAGATRHGELIARVSALDESLKMVRGELSSYSTATIEGLSRLQAEIKALEERMGKKFDVVNKEITAVLENLKILTNPDHGLKAIADKLNIVMPEIEVQLKNLAEKLDGVVGEQSELRGLVEGLALTTRENRILFLKGMEDIRGDLQESERGGSFSPRPSTPSRSDTSGGYKEQPNFVTFACGYIADNWQSDADNQKPGPKQIPPAFMNKVRTAVLNFIKSESSSFSFPPELCVTPVMMRTLKERKIGLDKCEKAACIKSLEDPIEPEGPYQSRLSFQRRSSSVLDGPGGNSVC